MYLREMRRLTNLFVFSFFSLSILAQSNSFRSSLNDYSDSYLYIDSLHSMMNLEVVPRVFGASSLSKDDNLNAFLLGISLRAQINDKLKMIGIYDYLQGNHHNQIKSYQDSLNINFPGYGLANFRYLFNASYRASKFIGIELEPKYFDIACERIQKAYYQPDMFVELPKKLIQDKMVL